MDLRQADASVADDLHNAYRRRCRRKELQMTDREKILIALREKPLKAFEIMKRVNIKNQDDCQSLLLKMRDDGAVKFDIHKGHWLAS
jgi:flagellar assembly factor FliW